MWFLLTDLGSVPGSGQWNKHESQAHQKSKPWRYEKQEVANRQGHLAKDASSDLLGHHSSHLLSLNFYSPDMKDVASTHAHMYTLR